MKLCINCPAKLSVDAKFCSNCGTPQPDHLTCPNCKYPNEGNSKFCQECAHPLVENAVPWSSNAPKSTSTTRKSVPQPEETPPIPTKGITIEFPYSTSQSFEFAVSEARNLPSFQQFGEDKKAIYRVNIDPAEIESLFDLIEHMKGWRKRFLYVDGEKVPWDSIFEFAYCYESKKASFKPQFYCFGFENEWELNAWGCVNARLPFRESADWFTWGRWLNNTGDWEFDKQRIRHELEKNLYSYRFCPALNFERIEAVISALPPVVNPTKDSKWKFVEAWQEDGRPALKSVKRTEWGDEVSLFVGVEPNGPRVLEEIAKKVGFQLR